MTDATITHRFVRPAEGGGQSLHLLVDGMHCPSCVALIENALLKQDAVMEARLNLSTRRLKVTWQGPASLADAWVDLITGMGYRAAPFDPATAETEEKREEKFLLRAMAVAGFASGNLMLFSVALWFSDDISMGVATRTMFQWLQAAIALPVIAYSGQPFFRSAWRVLRQGHTNMDVPISVAVILTAGMSLFETVRHGPHAYFESCVMLLFFLLIGRYLEARAKGRARGAAHDLLQMMTGHTYVEEANGSLTSIPFAELREGMRMHVAAGEKIGADGIIVSGVSEIDTSLITGESLPRSVIKGECVFAGTLNVSAPLILEVTKAGENSLLADIVRLMETAEQGQAHYVTLADRISGWYTPLVHLLALATFLGWWVVGGAAWQEALLMAATVLIITCPCALGLAVPVVQVLASGELMRRGILLKSGSALERLAPITHVVFDKTGTLTLGMPVLQHASDIPPHMLQLAASLAVQSRHPLSQAVARAYTGILLPINAIEVPGSGLEAEYESKRVRLGNRAWCGVSDNENDSAPELWLAVGDEAPHRFLFSDSLREDAVSVVFSLGNAGLLTTLLSGDRVEAVQHIASEVGIDDAHALLTPVEKVEYITRLKAAGETVLMVGDGLNDAPSLAAADVSMSPASAIDISQNAADIVFQGARLLPVLWTWQTARYSQKLVKQNFWLATVYNLIAIPLAVMGYVTPLVAAVAMSSSSLIVISNSMRLNLMKEKEA